MILIQKRISSKVESSENDFRDEGRDQDENQFVAMFQRGPGATLRQLPSTLKVWRLVHDFGVALLVVELRVPIGIWHITRNGDARAVQTTGT